MQDAQTHPFGCHPLQGDSARRALRAECTSGQGLGQPEPCMPHSPSGLQFGDGTPLRSAFAKQ
jgi:hypothetical protein